MMAGGQVSRFKGGHMATPNTAAHSLKPLRAGAVKMTDHADENGSSRGKSAREVPNTAIDCAVAM